MTKKSDHIDLSKLNIRRPNIVTTHITNLSYKKKLV